MASLERFCKRFLEIFPAPCVGNGYIFKQAIDVMEISLTQKEIYDWYGLLYVNIRCPYNLFRTMFSIRNVKNMFVDLDTTTTKALIETSRERFKKSEEVIFLKLLEKILKDSNVQNRLLFVISELSLNFKGSSFIIQLEFLYSLLYFKNTKVTPKELRTRPQMANNQRYECSDCNKTYKYKYCLQRHIREVHEVTGKFKCPTCNKTYNYNRGLQRHIREVHEATGWFKCLTCNKTYNTERGLQKHKTGFCKRSKRYECPICNKTYKHNGGLYNHMNDIHMTLKRPECLICNRTYTSKRTLLYHIQTVHKWRIKVHWCKKCNKCFTRKTRFEKHSC